VLFDGLTNDLESNVLYIVNIASTQD